MENGIQSHSITPGGAGAGMIIVALPVAGVGPASTASVLVNTLIVSGLVVLAIIFLIIGCRILARGKPRS